MTKKPTGLEPRGFRWVIKDRLAVSERIGGYGFILDRNATCVTYPPPEAVHRRPAETDPKSRKDFLNAAEFPTITFESSVRIF